MSWEYIVVVIFSCLLHAFILNLIYQKISTNRFSNKISNIIYNIAYFCLSLLVFLLVQNKYLSLILEISLIYILGLAYKMNIISRLVTPIIAISLFIISEMVIGSIIMSITSMSVEETQSNFFFYMQGMLGSKILVLFLVLIYRNNYKVKKIKGLGIMNVYLILVPIIVNALLYILQELMMKNTDMQLYTIAFISALCFLIIIVLSVYVIDYCIKMYYKNRRLETVNNTLNEQMKSFNSLVDNYKFNNKQLHDINNQLVVLKGMCKNNEDCKNEIEKVENIVKKTRNTIYTGCAGVDAIMNEKFNVIATSKINFDKTIIVSKISIDTVKIAILIANLLDNAIEESLRLKEKNMQNKIVFNIKSTDQILNIYVKNKKRNIQELKTSKKDPYKHGFGKEIINQLVKELDGNILVEQTENEYIVSVVLMQNAS